MALPCEIPRQLAPTVGQTAAVGVTLRTGPLSTGVRIATGLVTTFGSLHFVDDNTGCFGDDDLPEDGTIMEFGEHRVFVALIPEYPAVVLACLDSLSEVSSDDEGISTLNVYAEVMVSGVAGDPAAPSAPPAPAPEPNTMQAVIQELSTPIAASVDPAEAARQLEISRLSLVNGANAIAAKQRQLEARLREFNGAHGFTPVPSQPGFTPMDPAGPSRLDEVRRRGGGLRAEMSVFNPVDNNEPAAPPGYREPVYSSPAKNLKAAQIAQAEVVGLQGEELAYQQHRVQDLLNAACVQQATYNYDRAVSATALAGNTPRAGGPMRNDRQASSPHVEPQGDRPREARRERSVNSGKQKDPAAGGNRNKDPQPAAGASRNKDKQPVRDPAIRAEVSRIVARGTVKDRLGPLHPDDHLEDARQCLDKLELSRKLEEEDVEGHPCFGPRIAKEPFPAGFMLPRSTAKYDGTVKPADWLADYVTAVAIAGGNRRVAVRYVPLMLLESTHIWLNSLPKASINTWIDFEEAFVRNFTGTYKRPGRPDQLAACKQGPSESDRDYLARWCSLHNSCEGVHDVEAKRYFMDGCRDSTLLKHKLNRSKDKNLSTLR